MPRVLLGAVAVLLLLHGAIHLMGTTVYLRLGKVEGLTYKTTLLAGRWDLGEGGIRVFGALWIVPAMGFALAAMALWAGWDWWRALLIGVALLSLVVTLLDWAVAYAGVVVNMLILCGALLAPRLATWFVR